MLAAPGICLERRESRCCLVTLEEQGRRKLESAKLKASEKARGEQNEPKQRKQNKPLSRSRISSGNTTNRWIRTADG
jgi:hypothetical protein